MPPCPLEGQTRADPQILHTGGANFYLVNHTIYGLFDFSGRCRYVGQTRVVRNRKLRHREKYPELRFKVIRECQWVDRIRLERQIVMAYRKRGFCDLNSSNHYSIADNRKVSSRKDPAISRFVTVADRNGVETRVSEKDYDRFFAPYAVAQEVAPG